MNQDNRQLRNAGTNQIGMRQFNERLILSLIREQGALTKAEIAKTTKLTPQTATIIINRLKEQELLIAGKKIKGGRGQPSTPYSLNPDGALSLGIKIGRSSLEVLLIGFTGEIRSRLSYNYPFPNPVDIFPQIRRSLEHLLGSLSADQYGKVVGIGVAAPYSMEGWAEELPGSKEAREAWRKTDILAEIAKISNLPSTLTNDATAACIAELTFGNPQNWKSFLYFYVGTFMGGGLVINGHIYAGRNTNAGAMGSIPLDSKRQLINDASIHQLLQKLNQQGLNSSFLEGTSEINPDAWQVFTEWTEGAAKAIAYSITSGCAFIDPEGVIIDGRMPAKATDYLVSAIQKACKEANWEGLFMPEIISGNIGFEARALGGALLPIYSNFAPDSDAFLKATN